MLLGGWAWPELPQFAGDKDKDNCGSLCSPWSGLEEALQTAARANRGQYKQENRAGANRKGQGMGVGERERESERLPRHCGLL